MNNNNFVAEELDSPINNSGVNHAIKRLKNYKSPGVDGVPAEIFKVIFDMFIPILVQLFNKMYDYRFFLLKSGLMLQSVLFTNLEIKINLKIIGELVYNQF